MPDSHVTIITPDGVQRCISIHLGSRSLPDVLREMVHGPIEHVALAGSAYLFFNSDAHLLGLDSNNSATALAHFAESISPNDHIAGIAVVVPTVLLE